MIGRSRGTCQSTLEFATSSRRFRCQKSNGSLEERDLQRPRVEYSSGLRKSRRRTSCPASGLRTHPVAVEPHQSAVGSPWRTTFCTTTSDSSPRRLRCSRPATRQVGLSSPHFALERSRINNLPGRWRYTSVRQFRDQRPGRGPGFDCRLYSQPDFAVFGAWKLGVHHIFANKYTLEVRYVGTRGIHLPVQQRLNRHALSNEFLPTYLTAPARRPRLLTSTLRNSMRYPAIVPAYDAAGFSVRTLSHFEPYGSSKYNGLSVQFAAALPTVCSSRPLTLGATCSTTRRQMSSQPFLLPVVRRTSSASTATTVTRLLTVASA